MTIGRVEQCNTRTHKVDGYKILPVSILMGYKDLPIPHTRQVPYPLGTQWIDQILYMLLTFLLSLIVYWELEHEILIFSRHVDYGQCLITRVIEVWDAKLL
jgi:hypothetical protein